MEKQTQDLRKIFESDWCGTDTFIEQVLEKVFGKYEEGYDAITTDKDVKQKAAQAGILEIRHAATFNVLGTGLRFFDITVSDEKKLENSRVGIQSIVRQYVEQFDGALIVFHHKDVKNKEWRLSYVKKEATAKDSTSAKRYTYILGKNHPARTVSERFQCLIDKKDFLTIDDLTAAFSVEALTKQFYDELFSWYEWACETVTFPKGSTVKDKKGKFNVRQTKENNELNIIRLITRFMFVWFIKQKDLIPSWIFDEGELKKVLTDFDAQSAEKGNYYNAVIQNLFFATLNKKIEERAFASDTAVSKNRQFGVKFFYRDRKDKTFFKESREQIIERFKGVPFLNGGLFECLDHLTDDGENKKNVEVFIDGFSRESGWMAFVPNMLFWQQNDGKHEGHEGLIHLLSRYNFTVEENSPSDVQVALDPELLGKVFENLLGTYNPETSETARKDSGSFYTPREIVSFMIDEALKHYLTKEVKGLSEAEAGALFDDGKETYEGSAGDKIIRALKCVKILDPACGSGAFPMGALQRIVQLIAKCGGEAQSEKELYALKLELIENCLFGSDIQPIAVQICKLRFFISLICGQEKTDSVKDNYGFNPLPNLETKFVAADTLTGIAREENKQPGLFDNPELEDTKKELEDMRKRHFSAKTADEKHRYREKDRALREKLAELLKKDRIYDNKEAKQLASWNPYDQNAVSPFFDAEWMFGVKDGFDIVIGNPPYIQLQKDGGKLALRYQNQGFAAFAKTGDIYCLFYERGSALLKKGGRLCFITSNKWMRAGYGEKLRAYLAENTNPLLLVDFAGVKVFESATVDTNILMFEKTGEKEVNKNGTPACLTKDLTKKDLAALGTYVKEHACSASFNTEKSWVILSPVEQSIKRKIEAAGTPLKDWDINIYRGILTGCNDAFIINTQKRNEILENCKTEDEKRRTEELIRPILRGRDIKRYGYEWADLWLIATFPSRKYDIEQYPAVRDYFLSFGKERLEQTGQTYIVNGEKITSRKKTTNKWFETQDSISYWDEFNKPKICWARLMRISKNDVDAFPRFAEAATGIFVVDSLCFFTGDCIKQLCTLLNSKFAAYYFYHNIAILDNGGMQMRQQYVEQIPLPLTLKNIDNISDDDIYNAFSFTEDEVTFIDNYLEEKKREIMNLKI